MRLFVINEGSQLAFIFVLRQSIIYFDLSLESFDLLRVAWKMSLSVVFA